MTRRAFVRIHGELAGTLEETCGHIAGAGSGMRFTYDRAWLEREDAAPISLTLPLRRESYEWTEAGCFFENLLPEGATREMAAASLRLSPDDVPGLVVALGGDVVGAVEVVREAPARKDREPCEKRNVTWPGELRLSMTARGAAAEKFPGVGDRLLSAPFAIADVRRLAEQAIGILTLPGMQRKLPMLLVAGRRGSHKDAVGIPCILKPQTPARCVPENEFLSLQIAAAAGVEACPAALVTLADGSLACLVQRFDRSEGGSKLPVDDFCQLTGRLSARKWDGNAELCADIVRRHASESLVEMARLFRRLLVAWWIGDGHLHLKNLALVTSRDGLVRLSPAYDLQCTCLLDTDEMDDRLALPVRGKQAGLTRNDWLRFADSCGLRPLAAERMLREVAGTLTPALSLVDQSQLPADLKARYADLLQRRVATLTRRTTG